MRKLTVSDLIAMITAAISLPYLAGFFDWIGFLHVFGIAPSEVSLTQADYLLASLNMLPDKQLPGLGLIVLVSVLIAAAAFAWMYRARLAPILLRHVYHADVSPPQSLAEKPPDPDSVTETDDPHPPAVQKPIVATLGLCWLALAALAITSGYTGGTDRAREITEGGSTQSSFLLAFEEGTRFDTRSGPGVTFLSRPEEYAKIILNDGKTIFLFVRSSDDKSNMRGRVMRIPISPNRIHSNLVPRTAP